MTMVIYLQPGVTPEHGEPKNIKVFYVFKTYLKISLLTGLNI